ncbi:histidine kinase [uncultured Mucilaginibacter sp.]|uniref:sensor histidine kinase n=1 Tax=uncultured Mucilaginibacter sp. TaxID=797541 RepID=UPI00260C6E2D|nr:histidine kinase [uncultured Mucilaginibacter sp.]
MTKKEIRYHIIGWTLYWLYLIFGNAFIFKPNKFPIFDYSMVFVKMVEFYVCYLWVYPNFLNKGKIPQLIGGIAVAIGCFILTRFLLEEVAFDYFFHFHNYFGYTAFSYSLDNVYFGSSAVILSLAVYSSFDALRKEQENKSLREEKTQAELAFLKTQINPHFLYNTLNYIYSLAYPVSDKLADAVIKLSQLMRYMLTENPDGQVDLQKEVDYIENYISIYQLRFEDAFFVDFKAEGDIAGKRVAALLLIPFVENAFKHGVVNDPSRPIRINLKLTGQRLEFTVSNKISQNQKDYSTGVGLVNVRRRLELLYPKQHEFFISNNGQTYKATLVLSF